MSLVCSRTPPDEKPRREPDEPTSEKAIIRSSDNIDTRVLLVVLLVTLPLPRGFPISSSYEQFVLQTLWLYVRQITACGQRVHCDMLLSLSPPPLIEASSCRAPILVCSFPGVFDELRARRAHGPHAADRLAAAARAAGSLRALLQGAIDAPDQSNPPFSFYRFVSMRATRSATSARCTCGVTTEPFLLCLRGFHRRLCATPPFALSAVATRRPLSIFGASRLQSTRN